MRLLDSNAFKNCLSTFFSADSKYPCRSAVVGTMGLRHFKGLFLGRSDQWHDTTNFITRHSSPGTGRQSSYQSEGTQQKHDRIAMHESLIVVSLLLLSLREPTIGRSSNTMSYPK